MAPEPLNPKPVADRNPPSPWGDIPAAGAYLRVSESTVRRKIKTGEIPAVKIGNQWRVHLGALENTAARVMEAAAQREAVEEATHVPA